MATNVDEDLLDISPSSHLTFHRPFTSAVVRDTLTLTNRSSAPVAFKVKTTAPKQYCVRPNSGIVEPNASKEMQVLLQPMKEDPPADFKCKDKFLVQYASVAAHDVDLPINDLWAQVEGSGPGAVHERKLRCVFAEPLEEISTSAVDAAVKVSGASNQDVPVTNKVKFEDVQRSTPATVDSLQRELKDAKERVSQLQKACDQYQQRLALAESGKPSSKSSALLLPSPVLVILIALIAFIVGKLV